MTLCYDSVTGDAIPTNAPIVAGYVDGAYGPGDIYGSGWSTAAWARYPNALHVTITVIGSPGARAADCESGAMTPTGSAQWAYNEIRAGRRPTIYASEWDWYNLVDPALASLGLERGRDVDGWMAWIGPAEIPAGFVARQYAQGVMGENGSRVDLSVTDGVWPATTVPPVTPPPIPSPSPVEIFKPLSGRVGMLNKPAVAIAPTPSGKGYTLVAADGGTFNYGDAPMLGSLASLHLNAPIVDAKHTPDGKGLILLATDGGIFCLGDAQFHGSMGGQHLNAPMVSIGITPTGNGYWTIGADGGVFNFGDAAFEGSAA